MINAQDLKIGNYVVLSEDGTIFKVEEISKKGLVVQNENETVWIETEAFEPIPLTEEILLKCGFEKDGLDNYVSRYVCIYDNIRSINIGINGCDIDLECPLYLHQLQNLYFVLIGEELQINL